MTVAPHVRDAILDQGGVVPGFLRGNGNGYGIGDGYGIGTGDSIGDGGSDGIGGSDGYGYSDGDGGGYGYSDGYSDGDGGGDGGGYGYSDGYIDGDGDGYGYSDGDGDSGGDGYGDGAGDGYGYGFGDGAGESDSHTMEGDMLTDRASVPATHTPYIITTSRRAFFGYIDLSKCRVEGGVSYVTDILRARNTLRWGDVGGVEGLAETGPGAAGSVSKQADIAILYGVVALRECTPEATERFESMAAVSS